MELPLWYVGEFEPIRSGLIMIKSPVVVQVLLLQ